MRRFNWHYEEAAAYVARGSRGGSYRPAPLGEHTVVIAYPDDTVALRYHITDLVTWHPDGQVVIDTRPGQGSDRWGDHARSPTVLKRINTYAPVVVSSDFDNVRWLVDMAGDDCIFHDGFAVGPDYQLEVVA